VCDTPLSRGSKLMLCKPHADATAGERAAAKRQRRAADRARRKRPKLSPARLEYLRLWKKTRPPRGPMCTNPGCTTQLVEPATGKHKDKPLCFECRVTTRAVQRNIQPTIDARRKHDASSV
jgi:hypothetical protein